MFGFRERDFLWLSVTEMDLSNVRRKKEMRGSGWFFFFLYYRHLRNVFCYQQCAIILLKGINMLYMSWVWCKAKHTVSIMTRDFLSTCLPNKVTANP